MQKTIFKVSPSDHHQRNLCLWGPAVRRKWVHLFPHFLPPFCALETHESLGGSPAAALCEQEEQPGKKYSAPQKLDIGLRFRASLCYACHSTTGQVLKTMARGLVDSLKTQNIYLISGKASDQLRGMVINVNKRMNAFYLSWYTTKR